MTVNRSSSTTTEPLFVDENTARWNIFTALSQAAVVLILCATSWIIASMVVYGQRTNKLKAAKGGKVYIAVIAAMSVPLLSHILILILFQAPNIPGVSDYCELLADLMYIFLFTSFLSSYLCLWARQRTFYANPYLKSMGGKCLPRISWLALGVLVLAYIVALCAALIPNATYPTDIGCMYRPRENQTKIEMLGSVLKYENYIALSAQIIVQISFLFLFAYPLLHNKFGKERIEDRKGGKDKILRTVQRSLICTLIATITDIVTMVVVQVYHANNTRFAIVLTIYVIDNFINNICVLRTFAYFKEVLTEFCQCKCNRDSQKNLQVERNNSNIEMSMTEL